MEVERTIARAADLEFKRPKRVRQVYRDFFAVSLSAKGDTNGKRYSWQAALSCGPGQQRVNFR